MNLNISTQVTNNFQGNNNSVENGKNKGEFEGLFKTLENELKDLDSSKEDKSIDYNLIQNILSNLQILNQTQDINTLQKQEGEVNLQNLIEELSGDKKIDNNLLSNLKNNIDIVLNNEDNNIPENMKEILETPDKNIKNLLDRLKTKTPSQAELVVSDKQSTNNIDAQDGLQLDDVNLQQYNKLEVSGLSAKNNIVQTNKFDNADKDLSMLESIADKNDSQSFMALANQGTTSEVSTENKTKTEQPIKDIRQSFISEDVVKTVKYLRTNGLEEVTVKVSPKELGEVTIRLVKQNGETNLAITVNKEDSFDLINKNLQDISKHLSEMNIKVKDITVDIKNNNNNYFTENMNQEFDRKNDQNQNQNQRKKSRYTNSNAGEKEEFIESKLDDKLNILI